MGGLVIETVRPGVQFIPDAAAAFRRSDAEVRAVLGRGIDVNSTYRDWDTQLRMYNAWQAYVQGRGPYPGHSKALHPSDPLAFHVAGTALDSDDWTNTYVVNVLAYNGFIRNRLYIPNEKHHFEWLRNSDRNYGKPVSSGSVTASKPAPVPESEEDDMPKNSGFIYRGASQPSDQRTVLICNYGSGLFHEYTNSTSAADSAYNAAIAKAFDTPSFAEITVSHAEVIKKSLKAG